MFTIGDNDTFPLWYMQEVEDYRTDIKLINTSLFAKDWYIDQQKRKIGHIASWILKGLGAARGGLGIGSERGRSSPCPCG